MTDSDIRDIRDQASRNFDRAKEELAAQRFKIETIADGLENLVRGLRAHPEIVTGTPQIGNPDYRKELQLLDRQAVVTACDELQHLQEKARIAQKRSESLQHGSSQSLVE